ncbi:esterase-like activity of phytase family protein [Sphingosinithalassobacter portus]|uniref:esterase-like activity of phytase family protein n=1 Tax=Stakelama portus TaxID=2676234 RepID=UPI0011AB5389|nr:esterase-like activity of phytase family protein [Sphingosinithalassobacter portus]
MVTKRSVSGSAVFRWIPGRASAWRFFLLALILSPFAALQPEWRYTLGPARAIVTQKVALDPGNPGRKKLGSLTYLGGVRLMSRDSVFGGFSDLAVVGDRFILLSDRGGIVDFRMGRDWQPRDVRFADLGDGPGQGWNTLQRDSESLAHDPATGKFWVGFEVVNQIWRYTPDLRVAEQHVAPPAMAKWIETGGPESMARLANGAFVVLSEWSAGDNPRLRDGIWFAGDPVEAPRHGFRFSYRPPRGYAPTSLAELPDGDLLVLLRRFRLPVRFDSRIERIPRESIRAGAIVSGSEVATLAAPLIHDNFEGIAVTRENGATIVWIVSDDNQMMLQRSLLLKFRLDAER